MRAEYRQLQFRGEEGKIFETFLNDFEEKLFDPDVDKNELVCETIYELETGKSGYNEALDRARIAGDLAGQAHLLNMDPRNNAQEPEYYGDIDVKKYSRNKPIHWLWTYFDKLPVGRNCLLGFPLRRLMGRYMFAHLGENVKLFHNIEFTYGYNLHIEDNVIVHREVMLDDRGGIHIKKNASISDYAHIYSHHHHADDIMNIELKPVVIGENARITYHSTVLAGQNVGNWAILGALGLATKSLENQEIKGGIPAKPLGKVDPKGGVGVQKGQIILQDE